MYVHSLLHIYGHKTDYLRIRGGGGESLAGPDTFFARWAAGRAPGDKEDGADRVTRTPDPRITNAVKSTRYNTTQHTTTIKLMTYA